MRRQNPRGRVADLMLDAYTIAWIGRRLLRPAVAQAQRAAFDRRPRVSRKTHRRRR
jgi:hypothetical protein